MEQSAIANNIKSLRETRHWTQEELAIAAGIQVRTVQRAEKGQPLAVDTLKAFAAVFDTTIEHLSSTPAQLESLLNDFKERYVIIDLRPLKNSRDLSSSLSATHAFYLHRNANLTEKQADVVAEFEQDLNDYGNIWGELDPSQRREGENILQTHIEALTTSGISASFGRSTQRMVRNTGTPFHFSTLYVATVAGDEPMRGLIHERPT